MVKIPFSAETDETENTNYQKYNDLFFWLKKFSKVGRSQDECIAEKRMGTLKLIWSP